MPATLPIAPHHIDPEIWVLVALSLFLGLLYVLGVYKKAIAFLDRRAEGIKKQMDEARKLREEAQKILSSYQRKKREAELEAARIIDAARKQADACIFRLEQEAKEHALFLEKTFTQRLELYEKQVANNFQTHITSMTLSIVEDVLRDMKISGELGGAFNVSLKALNKDLSKLSR